MKYSSFHVLVCPILTKSTEYSILKQQNNLLFAPRPMHRKVSDGVIFFLGVTYAY